MRKKILLGIMAVATILSMSTVVTGCSSPEPTCIKSGCNSSRASGSSYCYLHKPYTPSTTYKSNTSSSSSSTYKSNSSSSSGSTTSKPSYSSSYSSKKKSTTTYEMPDCDDYEDYDDFMDDWDGCMPDGSDAEDYWEDW